MIRYPQVRLKWSVSLRNQKSSGQLPYIGLEHVESWTGRYHPSNDADSFSDAGSRHFEVGDVLFGKLRPYLAKAIIPRTSGSCTSELLVLRPSAYDKRFLLYWLLAPQFIDEVDSSTYGAQMPRASWDFIGNVASPLPPLPTQRAIADFLDRKTAAIDALIEKKERLIALLAEKRAALIHRAVTKGLDSNVPMKESGVEWIGEIPAHWETRRLRYIANRLQGRLIVQPHLYFEDDGVPIVFGYNIKDGVIDEGGLSKVSFAADKAHPHARVSAGDLLTVRLGNPGMTAVVPPSLDGCHFASIMWIHQHPRVDSGWLCHAMNSPVVQGQIEAANYGATLGQFNIAVAVDWVLPFPPKKEQYEIAAFLSHQLSTIAKVRNRIAEQLDRLREYRQALITAAVTGQLTIGEAIP